MACNSCGADVIWGITEKGQRIPLDVAEVREGLRFRLEHGNRAVRCAEGELGRVAHFATCPNADKHRKRA